MLGYEYLGSKLMLMPISYVFDFYFIFLETFVVGDVIVFSLEVVAVVYVHNANSTFFFC